MTPYRPGALELEHNALLWRLQEKGPVRALPNWPRAMRLVRGGYASLADCAVPGRAVFAITDLGRRYLKGFRQGGGTAAGGSG